MMRNTIHNHAIFLFSDGDRRILLVKNNMDQCPIQLAAEGGHMDCVLELLERHSTDECSAVLRPTMLTIVQQGSSVTLRVSKRIDFIKYFTE